VFRVEGLRFRQCKSSYCSNPCSTSIFAAITHIWHTVLSALSKNGNFLGVETNEKRWILIGQLDTRNCKGNNGANTQQTSSLSRPRLLPCPLLFPRPLTPSDPSLASRLLLLHIACTCLVTHVASLSLSLSLSESCSEDMHTFTQAHTHTETHTHTHVQLHVSCAHAHAQAQAHAHAHAQAHAQAHAHMKTLHKHMHIHTHTRTRTHALSQAHTRTHTHVKTLRGSKQLACFSRFSMHLVYTVRRHIQAHPYIHSDSRLPILKRQKATWRRDL
jgi:hypothetical protein